MQTLRAGGQMLTETPLMAPVVEAALQLGISVERCRRLVQTGALRGQVLAGRYFVDRTSVDAWKEKNKQVRQDA